MTKVRELINDNQLDLSREVIEDVSECDFPRVELLLLNEGISRDRVDLLRELPELFLLG